MKNPLLAVAAGLLILLAALPVAYLGWPARTPVTAAPTTGSLIADNFVLQDADGRSVRQTSYRGQWMLVSFGFTHCPDVCPTTLSTLAGVLDALGEQSARLQPIFVSLDPARDTPQALADYTAFFDERILGLTGSEAQLRRMAEAYGLYFRQVPSGDSYLLDHSATVYLIDPDGALRRLFSPREQRTGMAGEIAALLESS